MATNDAYKRKILVVEPDRELAFMLNDFLTAQNFEVESAASGDEGIEKTKEFMPDIVLLSRELPMGDENHGPDGLRVLKVLKHDRKLSRIPVILASSEAKEGDFDRYRKLKFSADDYLAKPFEDTEILRRIENLVGFDISESVDDIQDKIQDVMDDKFTDIFDADPEELGLSVSAAARKEVAQLLEHVGQELDLHEQEMSQDEQPLFEASSGSPEAVEERDDTGMLRRDLEKANRRLEKLQKVLANERRRSQETKKEWKNRLQEIASKLQEKEEREARIRQDFEAMRERFADLELDHTMEMERVQAEKRRVEEELVRYREMAEAASNFSGLEMADDLKTIAKALQLIISRLESESE
jgi:DNA-binding response OmpR family regulator